MSAVSTGRTDMGKDYLNSEGYPDPTAFEAIRSMEKRPYRPLVYICSPYAGDVETNVSNARRYCRFAVDSGCIPIAPHLLYPQFMDDTDEKERKLSLFFGNVLMDRCAEVWVFGDRISAGMDAEIKRSRRKGYRLRWFTSDCREKSSPVSLDTA